MARGELLRKLFLSHKRGAEDEFRAAALEIVSEEQAKKNRQLARDKKSRLYFWKWKLPRSL
jgi:hypothetical protein